MMLPDMFPSPLYPVHLCLWTGIERELEIKDVYVGDAAQHEPGRPVEVDDGGVGPGHGLGNPLIGQLSSTVQIKHLNDFK